MLWIYVAELDKGWALAERDHVLSKQLFQDDENAFAARRAPEEGIVGSVLPMSMLYQDRMLYTEVLFMLSTRSARRTTLFCEPLEDRLALDATSFVTSLYANILSRAPDASGLALYVQEIKDGSSNQQVAQQFWVSPEHRGIQVDAFYQTFLNRLADSSGRAFWVNQLVTGAVSELQVEVDFLTSAEYMNMLSHNTPTTYISGLYFNVLGREASAADQVYWQNVLQQTGSAAVATGIVTSAESYTDILFTDYLRYLGRTPDSSGLNHFLTQLQTGQGTVASVAESILGSAEYASNH